MGGDVCDLASGASATTENVGVGPRESRGWCPKVIGGCWRDAAVEEANLILVGLSVEVKCSTPAQEPGGPHRVAQTLQALHFHPPPARARAAGAERSSG